MCESLLSTDRSQVQSLFKSLLIKSVIQLELIHAIDNIIFYPTASRNDDERNLAAVKVSMADNKGWERGRCCILTRTLLSAFCPFCSSNCPLFLKFPVRASLLIVVLESVCNYLNACTVPLILNACNVPVKFIKEVGVNIPILQQSMAGPTKAFGDDNCALWQTTLWRELLGV